MNTTSLLRLGGFALLWGSLAVAVGCSGGSPSTGGGNTSSSDPTPELAGDYVAQTPGPIAEIAFFQGGKYGLSSDDCGSTAAPCTSTGAYRIDGNTLSLTDDATGQTQTIALDVLQSENAPASGVLAAEVAVVGGDDRVHPDGFCLGTGGCDAAPNNAPLVSNGSGSLVNPGNASVLVQCVGQCSVLIKFNGQTLMSASGSNGVNAQANLPTAK